MNNFVNSGETIDLVAPYAVNSGAGALVGNLFGIAKTTLANGASGPFQLKGVVTHATDTGAAWSQGDLIYWDNTNKVMTKTATSNKLIGAAVAAKLSAATTGSVRLNGTTVS